MSQRAWLLCQLSAADALNPAGSVAAPAHGGGMWGVSSWLSRGWDTRDVRGVAMSTLLLLYQSTWGPRACVFLVWVSGAAQGLVVWWWWCQGCQERRERASQTWTQTPLSIRTLSFPYASFPLSPLFTRHVISLSLSFNFRFPFSLAFSILVFYCFLFSLLPSSIITSFAIYLFPVVFPWWFFHLGLISFLFYLFDSFSKLYNLLSLCLKTTNRYFW